MCYIFSSSHGRLEVVVAYSFLVFMVGDPPLLGFSRCAWFFLLQRIYSKTDEFGIHVSSLIFEIRAFTSFFYLSRTAKSSTSSHAYSKVMLLMGKVPRFLRNVEVENYKESRWRRIFLEKRATAPYVARCLPVVGKIWKRIWRCCT